MKILRKNRDSEGDEQPRNEGEYDVSERLAKIKSVVRTGEGKLVKEERIPEEQKSQNFDDDALIERELYGTTQEKKKEVFVEEPEVEQENKLNKIESALDDIKKDINEIVSKDVDKLKEIITDIDKKEMELIRERKRVEKEHSELTAQLAELREVKANLNKILSKG